jgi:hypothetical protein
MYSHHQRVRSMAVAGTHRALARMDGRDEP